MSSNFDFDDNGVQGPYAFVNECVLVIGESQDFGGGSLAVKIAGNGDAYTLFSTTASGEWRLRPGKAPITLELTGATDPDLKGAIWTVI